MSTVKISDLPVLSRLNSNTSNTLLIGVDVGSDITGQLTATALAAALYLNNVLNVGNNSSFLPNTIAQFAGTSNNYVQINLENINNDYGTADYIVTANTGTDTSYYVDLGFANKNYNPSSPYNSLGTALNALDAYLYAQGGAGPGGNLVIGTTSTGTKINFIAGGSNSSNIIGYIDSTGIHFNSITSQISSQVSGNLAIAEAYTDTANTFIQTHYLANTKGVVTAGDFNVSGNTTNYGALTLNAPSTFPNTFQLLTISAASNNYSQPTTQTGYIAQITGYANTPTKLIVDSFGANTYGLIAGRTARGSASSPSSTLSGDVLMRFAGNGWGTTGFSNLGVGRIDIVAAENYTDSSKGSQIQFWNTQPGTNTLNQIATFNATEVTFSGHVYPSKGFIYTPLVYPSAQTAITIDFANNSLVRAQTTSGLTVSLKNYIAGKTVELWITNTSGTNQTFTTGISAINSTLNATTYTMPGTSTIYARYFCVDGTLANTLVSVAHS